MFKLTVAETELSPIGIGAQKIEQDNKDVVVVTFNSEDKLDDILPLFKNLKVTDAIKIQNENDELSFIGYSVMDDEIKTKIKDDGTYDYTISMSKSSQSDLEMLEKINELTELVKSLQSNTSIS